MKKVLGWFVKSLQRWNKKKEKNMSILEKYSAAIKNKDEADMN